MAAVTLDDFLQPKKKERTVHTKVEYTADADLVKFVKSELEPAKAERLIALTEKGKRLVKKLMLEGKIKMNPKPCWWDEV